MAQFYEIVSQVVALLHKEKRVSYRALRRQFGLDDAFIEDLKFELVRVKELARDKDGEMLVWTGDRALAPERPPDPGGPPGPAASAAAHGLPPAPDPGGAALVASTEQDGPAEAERRQLTVMFCDLVDSTSISGRLDPEDFREIVRAYQTACAQVVQGFDGHIAQYLGDGILVYFGYPRAHEDDALRAVLAGLGIVQAMEAFNRRLELERGFRLATRVGIHTGPAVVGAIGSGVNERLALGVTPNVAARIEAAAEPDTVVVSADTYRLTQGTVECEELGSRPLKGLAEPVPLYRVLDRGERQSGSSLVAAVGPMPLVGREDEFSELLALWQQVEDGEGQAVILSGDPGIGKSHLVEALERQVRYEGRLTRTFRCSAYHQNSALHPIMESIHRQFRIGRDDSTEVKVRKLAGGLGESAGQPEDLLPLLASLLSIPLPEDTYPPLNLSPHRQKEKTLDALAHWFLKDAREEPALLIFEDLHWADPSTLELLDLLLARVPAMRFMVLITFRREFSPTWTPQIHFSRLTVAPLGRPQVAEIINRVAGGKPLPEEVVNEVAAKTDGVPLFVEELTKMVLESDLLRENARAYTLRGRLTSLAIPVTLRDSLMARLDRLQDVREVAQLAAILGREFNYELIRVVSSLPDAALRQALTRLVHAELLDQRGIPPQARYAFKHVLIQDVACQSLLKRKRREYHRQVAMALVERFPGIVETEPELTAHHFTEAGMTEEAVSYWQWAGERAIRRSAHVEAVNHLTRGLELTAALPETPERVRRELHLQTALGPALIAIKGYGAEDVEKSYGRARHLCRLIGDTPELGSVLIGLEAFYLLRAELHTAQDLAQQLLALAKRQHDPLTLMVAHAGLGVVLFYRGDFEAALGHLEEGIALYDPRQHRMLGFQDPGVACLSWAAITHWLLGEPDKALIRGQEALDLARELDHPFSLAFALNWVARVHQCRREVETAKQCAAQAIALSSEQGFPFLTAHGLIMHGWSLAQQGQSTEGIAEMRRGLKIWRATGATLGGTYLLALGAEVYDKAGKTGRALAVLRKALSLAEHTGEEWWLAELQRLQGELLLNAGRADNEAKAAFTKALEVARRQGARPPGQLAAAGLDRLA